MRRPDMIGGLIVMFFGGLAISQAAQLEYWSRFGPGPGFIPLWSGVVIALGGMALFIQAWRRPEKERRPLPPEHKIRLALVAAVAGLTVLAALSINVLGFGISVFVFLLLLIGVVGGHRWWISLTVSGGLTLVFYMVFVEWLEVPLPKGFLGF